MAHKEYAVRTGGSKMRRTGLEEALARMDAHLREAREILTPPPLQDALEPVTVRVEDEKGRLMPVKALMRVHRCRPPLCMECRHILVRRMRPD
jgi:hypothetical protein